jgi:hypothetical protein
MTHNTIRIQEILQKEEYNGAARQLLINFKKAYVSIGKEILYTFIEVGIPIKIVKVQNPFKCDP